MDTLRHRMARAVAVALGLALAARGTTGCGSFAPGSSFPPGSDAGVSPSDAGAVQSCEETSECAANAICLYPAADSTIGHCTVPDGTCDGPQDTLAHTGRCYPDARCDLTGAAMGAPGQCEFTPASRPAFPTDARLTVDSPTGRTALGVTDGFSLQWETTALPTGAVTVAVIMDAPPARDAVTNRVGNPGHIVWIWSSADPGGAVQEGAVPLRFGARGITPAGALSTARWNRDTLPAGAYWWFVYVIDHGAVTSSSEVQHFHVGPQETADTPCTTADDCVALGDFPETAVCIASKCMHRCASNADCPSLGSRCDFTLVPPPSLLSFTVRHGGFCASPGTADAGM